MNCAASFSALAEEPELFHSEFSVLVSDSPAFFIVLDGPAFHGRLTGAFFCCGGQGVFCCRSLDVDIFWFATGPYTSISSAPSCWVRTPKLGLIPGDPEVPRAVPGAADFADTPAELLVCGVSQVLVCSSFALGMPGVFQGELVPGVVDDVLFAGPHEGFLTPVVDSGAFEEVRAAENFSFGRCGDHPPCFCADEIAPGTFHGALPVKSVAEPAVFWGDHGAFFSTLNGEDPGTAQGVPPGVDVVSFDFKSSCDFCCDQGVLFWVFDEDSTGFFHGALPVAIGVGPC
mmetsp:Transcript_16384/g.30763  ORF Transcript_16384/g.30763 Transcript_16384/m.30763 type:complete len:287 (-) Transcript_16384:1130-1990(-)